MYLYKNEYYLFEKYFLLFVDHQLKQENTVKLIIKINANLALSRIIVTSTELNNKEKEKFQTLGDERCDPVTSDVELDESTIIEGIEDVDEDDGDDELARNISSAIVPDPKRYSLPRHMTVDEPVKALK